MDDDTLADIRSIESKKFNIKGKRLGTDVKRIAVKFTVHEAAALAELARRKRIAVNNMLREHCLKLISIK